MTVYHGTDKDAAKQIIETGILKGDWPLFGVGVCLDIETAKNFAAITVQKHLKKGRGFARRQIAILKFEIPATHLLSATKEAEHNAYTLDKMKELKAKFELI